MRAKGNTGIIVCGRRYDIGRRVITFVDDPSVSAYTAHCIFSPSVYPTAPAKGVPPTALRYRPRRLLGADRTLTRLRQVISQVVVHHDGLRTARDAFRVVHD